MFRNKGKVTSYEDVCKAALKDPPPTSSRPVGGRWKGVKHEDLVKAFRTRLAETAGVRFAMSNDGYDIAFSMTTDPKKLQPPDKGLVSAIAVVASNARRFRSQAYYGVDVKETGRGLVLGRLGDGAERSVHYDLEADAEETVRLFRLRQKRAFVQVQQLKNQKLTDGEMDRLCMAAGRGGLIPWSRVGEVVKEWEDPRYDETEPRTAWAAYNCFSLAIAKNPPLSQIGQLEGFYGLLTAENDPPAAPKPAAGKKPRPGRETA